MKEFIRGIVTFILGLLVFTLPIIIGIIYNIFYPFVMVYKERDPLTFFRIWWRLIDGTFATIGNILYQFAEKYDMLGNVWGEWIEDLSTAEEKTTFGDKNLTISASVGFLEYENLKRSKAIKGLNKALNWAFGEKRHALGSWLLKLERDRIKKLNLKQNERKN